MVKRNFLTKMLLLCALIVGSVSSAWAVDVVDVLTVTKWAEYTGTCETNGTDHEGTSSSTSVKYIMQAYSGSSGQVRGNQSNDYANFSCRNSTIYSGYYVKEVKLVVTEGTLDGSTTNRSVVYFGTSAYGNPKDSDPEGTPVYSNENASGQTTLTWSNSNKDATYFILYNLKTAGTTKGAVVTVTWAPQEESNNPEVSLSANSLDFGKVNYGSSKEMTFTVTPANLTSNLTISCDNEKYTVSPTTISQSATSAQTITVTAAPTALTDDMDGTITISGGGLTSSKTVTLAATVGDPNVILFDFTNIDGFSNWSTSYTEHIVNYNEATVTFASACKQTKTITNQPVTKGGDVTIVLTNDTKVINSVTFVCQQWSDKAQTITLHYSTDGGESYVSTEITSSNFTISSNSLPEGTNAVKITFNSSDNQVGITSATLGIGDASTTTSPLDHITLSGDYPTSFTIGDTFSHAGMIVTATYEDNSAKVVTSSAEFTGYDMSTTGEQTVTVSYTEEEITKTATYNITVNEYVQPTEVTIQMTNSLFNQDVHTSGTAAEDMTFVGTQDNVTVTYFVPEDSYYFFNTSNTRPYNTCTLTYGAPTGYVITKIDFTSDGKNWETATPSVGEMTSTKVWEGSAESVTFSWEESGTRVKTVVVTLAKSAKISSYKWATFSSDKALDFTESDVKAYIVTGFEGTSITKEQVYVVPANTGLLLNAEAGTYGIPVATGETNDVSKNKLHAVLGGNQTVVSEGTGSDVNYVLSVKSGKVVFAWIGETAATVKAGQAYLTLENGPKPDSGNAPWLSIEGDDETTGIQSIERTMNDNQYYTLDGRRVAEPTKGLYIVNGKKVVIK